MISLWFAGLWAKIWKYVLIVGAVLAGIAVIFLKGRAAGVKAELPKVDAANAKVAVAVATTEQLESRHETDVAVDKLPDAAPGVSLGDAPADTAAGRLSEWADPSSGDVNVPRVESDHSKQG